MKYKTFLRFSLQYYSSIFPDEYAVLEHSFFVLGNGYWWHKGALSSGQTIKEMVASAQECGKRCEEYERETKEIFAKLDAEFAKSHPGFLEKKSEAIKNRIERDNKNKPKKLYPQSKRCTISEIPDNIQDDWLLAADKALNMVKAGVYIASDNDKKYLRAARRRVNKLKKTRGLA